MNPRARRWRGTRAGVPLPLGLENQLVFEVALLAAMLVTQTARAMEDEGMGLAELAILSHLDAEPGTSRMWLARQLAIDRPAVSEIVEDLEHEGIVESRDPALNGYGYAIRLTVHGRDVLAVCRAAARTAERRVLSRLRTDDRERLARYVRSTLPQRSEREELLLRMRAM